MSHLPLLQYGILSVEGRHLMITPADSHAHTLHSSGFQTLCVCMSKLTLLSLSV